MESNRDLEAEKQYRAAWNEWCQTLDLDRKLQLEKIMDDLQPKIGVGPNDPQWIKFKATLIHYDDAWAAMFQKAEHNLAKRIL